MITYTLEEAFKIEVEKNEYLKKTHLKQVKKAKYIDALNIAGIKVFIGSSDYDTHTAVSLAYKNASFSLGHVDDKELSIYLNATEIHHSIRRQVRDLITAPNRATFFKMTSKKLLKELDHLLEVRKMEEELKEKEHAKYVSRVAEMVETGKKLGVKVVQTENKRLMRADLDLDVMTFTTSFRKDGAYSYDSTTRYKSLKDIGNLLKHVS